MLIEVTQGTGQGCAKTGSPLRRRRWRKSVAVSVAALMAAAALMAGSGTAQAAKQGSRRVSQSVRGMSTAHVSKSSIRSIVGSQASSGQVNNGQVAANAVAERVQSAASTHHMSGFAGVEVSPSLTHPGVTIYRHGHVPDLLSRFAAAASASSASGIAAGVAVCFRWAPFTQAQLIEGYSAGCVELQGYYG
jgi:hypothetical protein